MPSPRSIATSHFIFDSEGRRAPPRMFRDRRPKTWRPGAWLASYEWQKTRGGLGEVLAYSTPASGFEGPRRLCRRTRGGCRRVYVQHLIARVLVKVHGVISDRAYSLSFWLTDSRVAYSPWKDTFQASTRSQAHALNLFVTSWGYVRCKPVHTLGDTGAS